jgi:hypothetical protein
MEYILLQKYILAFEKIQRILRNFVFNFKI